MYKTRICVAKVHAIVPLHGFYMHYPKIHGIYQSVLCTFICKLAMRQVFVMHMYRSDTGDPGAGARRTGVVCDHTRSVARLGSEATRGATLRPGTRDRWKKGYNPTAFFVPSKISNKQCLSGTIPRGSNWALLLKHNQYFSTATDYLCNLILDFGIGFGVKLL